MSKQLVVKGNKLVVATANVEKVEAKKVKFREIFGIRLGAKPSIELKTAVKVLKRISDKPNLTFYFAF